MERKDGISVDRDPREYRGFVGDIASKTFPKGPIRSSRHLCWWRLCSNRRATAKKESRDIVGSKSLEEVCEIVLDGELFFYRKEEKEGEMFGNIFESTILRILLEVVARFQRDFSALRTIALLTKRWRVVVSIPEIPAQLLREFVRLHRFEWSNALSGTRSPRRFFSPWCRDRYELLFIFYTVRILVFVPSYFTLLRHVCGVVESFFNAGDVWWKIVASLKY